MKTLQSLQMLLLGFLGGLLLGAAATVSAQGPYSAQVQNALNNLLAGNLAFTVIANTPTTVGALPSCAAGLKGNRMFVTDANATFTAGIGATVVAGGANNVPVTCDGSAWKIG